MLTIIILFVTGLCAMFAGFMRNRHLPKYIGILGVIAALISLHFNLGLNIEFTSFFTMFPLTQIMTAIVLVILLVILLVSGRYEEDYDWSAVISLMFFSTCGVILLLGLRNLLTLFLGIEIMSIPLYIMAASKRHYAPSLEAGLKYFILGSFASAFLLFGIALIYGTTGSFVMDQIIMVQSTQGADLPSFFNLGMIFVISAVLFKMSIAPFHFWSPDVYDGSPTIVTAFMTTIVKIGSAITMYYLLAGFFLYQFDTYFRLLIPVICISLIVGSLLGLLQHNVKRMLAYSGITHIAFILSAIILGIALKDYGIFVFYLLAYTVSGLIVFLIIDYLDNGNSVFIDHLNGLKSRQPLLAISFVIAVISMAGIPFTGGFVAKFRVLTGLYQLNKWVFIVALFSSALAIAYYLRLINRVLFYENNDDKSLGKNYTLITVSLVLAIGLIVMGIMPEFILQGIHKLFVSINPTQVN